MEPRSLESLPPIVSEPVRELKRRLAARFGERLTGVWLYGSWARGEPHVGSDVDVLVVIRGCTRAEQSEVTRIEVRVMLDTGAPLSLQVMSTEELEFLRSREVGFALDVTREGVSA